MANETTTTTADDLTHASLVQPVLIKALSARARLYRFARQFNLIGQATNAAKIPVQTSWWGSAADRGAGVDTEFNATEGSALGNTAVSTSSVTCTAAEYGVQITVTDNVNEDSVSGIDLARRGIYVRSDHARAGMIGVAQTMLNVFEGAVADIAQALAAKFEIPQRDLQHVLRQEFRELRIRAAEAARQRAEELPALIAEDGPPEGVEGGDVEEG